jgi:hypothetical protein
MRVVTFRHETEERLGFLVDDEVVDPKRVADQAGEAAYDNSLPAARAQDRARQSYQNRTTNICIFIRRAAPGQVNAERR